MRSVEVRLQNLTKHYANRFVAVDNLSLTVKPGEILALLGPSGCGKTSCLRMIAGLVEPTSGEIMVDGRAITHTPVHKRNVGMLFQNYALFPHMSVAENVAFGLQMRKFSKSECEAKVLKALDLVQLQPYRNRLPSQLSGGQQQRVALARALVIEPAMLLLDEPLGALDKSLRESMQVEIRTLQQRLGLTTIMVTHDQDEALTMADQIAVMNGGRLEQIASAANIYQRPATRFVAGFIGASNFFSGKVEPCPGGGKRLVTSTGISLPMADHSVATGDVTITVRPEAIALQPLGHARGVVTDAVPAKIEQVVYRGFIHHYYLRLDSGEQMLAYRQSLADHPDGACAQGDRVLLSWNAASTHVVGP